MRRRLKPSPPGSATPTDRPLPREIHFSDPDSLQAVLRYETHNLILFRAQTLPVEESVPGRLGGFLKYLAEERRVDLLKCILGNNRGEGEFILEQKLVELLRIVRPAETDRDLVPAPRLTQAL